MSTARTFAALRQFQFVQTAGQAYSPEPVHKWAPSTLLFVGMKSDFLKQQVLAAVPEAQKPVLSALFETLSPGASVSTAFLRDGADAKPTTVVVSALPSECSRYMSPIRPRALTSTVRSNSKKGDVAVVVALSHPGHLLGAANAVARAFPLFNMKTTDKPAKDEERVRVSFVCDQTVPENEHKLAQVSAECVRLAGKVCDTPAEDMNTSQFDEYVSAWVNDAASRGLPVKMVAKVVGDDLMEQNFGGIYNVGKQGHHAPRFLAISYSPAGAKQRVSLVGKGIVFDQGGTSNIKTGGISVGMKYDKGGAVGLFHAFRAAVESGEYAHVNLDVALCMAENAVGPDSYRNDDIITLYSGKTVEINNTDAEGRLVLGDGVAYVTKHFNPDLVIDMATLTGAQTFATGGEHGAVLCSRKSAEEAILQAGRRSGDVVAPLLFVPELHGVSEFKSEVADMKNSISSKNAPSACAGMFVLQHAAADWKGAFIHCDMAFPVTDETKRGTGFGVGLVLEALRKQHIHKILAEDKEEELF